MRRSAAPRKRAAMVNSLPMTLRVYRKLSFAVVPLAAALIKRRLKLGKEDPARIGERRGFSDDVRPRGPLVWVHGASVGEALAQGFGHDLGIAWQVRPLSRTIANRCGALCRAWQP